MLFWINIKMNNTSFEMVSSDSLNATYSQHIVIWTFRLILACPSACRDLFRGSLSLSSILGVEK